MATKKQYETIVREGFTLRGGDYEGFLWKNLTDLGRPDPEWRDDLACSTLTRWITGGRLTPQALGRLLDELLSDNYLLWCLGTTGKAAAVRRTFSLLPVAAILEYDRQGPFIPRERLVGTFEAVSDYLTRERVVTGFDEKLGWIHAWAHGADVFLELLASSTLDEGTKDRISVFIAEAIGRNRWVFQYGEDERLARAVLSYRGPNPSFALGHLARLSRILDGPGAPSMAALRNYRHCVKNFFVFAVFRKDEALLEATTSLLDEMGTFHLEG